MGYKYLLVEDSSIIRSGFCDFFVSKSDGNIFVDEAEDGDIAMKKIAENEYDLVFLDIMLPGASGFEICKALRKRSKCPIIFLTALGQEDNILRGYELGADDYITKPFSLKEVYAKSEAMVRRYKDREVPPAKVLGEIELNSHTMQVFSCGGEIELPPKEYFILKILMDSPDMVFSRNSLIDKVWGSDFDGYDRVVDVHIKNLRKKLGTAGKQIVTVIGGGYKITTKK